MEIVCNLGKVPKRERRKVARAVFFGNIDVSLGRPGVFFWGIFLVCVPSCTEVPSQITVGSYVPFSRAKVEGWYSECPGGRVNRGGWALFQRCRINNAAAESRGSGRAWLRGAGRIENLTVTVSVQGKSK